jgi:hypothetical protein
MRASARTTMGTGAFGVPLRRLLGQGARLFARRATLTSTSSCPAQLSATPPSETCYMAS